MYIFNKDYYDSEDGFCTNPCFDIFGRISGSIKMDVILNAYEPPISENTFNGKLYEKKYKRFNDNDYNVISKLDSYLLIDTDRLYRKLDERANLDFTTNQRWVIRTLLHDYSALNRNDRREWQTIDEMTAHLEDIKYNRKKTEKNIG